MLVLVSLMAVQSLCAQVPAPEIQSGIEPGYRSTDADETLGFNPFEPITEVRSDSNSELSQALLRRIKGYVIQPNGAPLLVIDAKSYRVRDKVPINAAAKSDEKSTDKKKDSAAPVGGDTVTILSISQSEAVFQKDDASGFGGESFKIFFNFKHDVDDAGKTNYNVWEMAGNGFFINEDGVAVVPLDIAQGAELSVLTPYGYSRATLVESDTKRGIGLLKVNIKSIPLYLTSRKPERAEEVFPVGYSVGQKDGIRFLEGFIRESSGNSIKLSPTMDGDLLGSVVLNRKAEVVGILVGQTQELSEIQTLSPQDAIFRKYTPSKMPEDGTSCVPTQSTIEQSVVKIFRKR